MTRTLARAERLDPQGGYVVSRPRSSDAIGLTLRSVFGNDARPPEDFASLLDRLNRVPSRD